MPHRCFLRHFSDSQSLWFVFKPQALFASHRPAPDGKDATVNKEKETPKRKSEYDENRRSYASGDCSSYVYERWNPETKSYDRIVLEAGRDGVDQELIVLLDRIDHEEDLNNRYEGELNDPVFQAKDKAYRSDPGNPDAVDPWDAIGSSKDDPGHEEGKLPENPDLAKVRKSVEEDLTEAQRDLYYRHFGMGLQLEEIRKEEVAESGKEKSLQSVHNRKKKIIARVAHQAFGVESVKRRKSRKD